MGYRGADHYQEVTRRILSKQAALRRDDMERSGYLYYRRKCARSEIGGFGSYL